MYCYQPAKLYETRLKMETERPSETSHTTYWRPYWRFTSTKPPEYTKLSWELMQNVCSKHHLPLIKPCLQQGYQRNRPHVSTPKIKAHFSSEKLVSIFIRFHCHPKYRSSTFLLKAGTNVYDYVVLPWRRKHYVLTKKNHPSTKLNGFVIAKTDILVLLFGRFKRYSRSRFDVRLHNAER